MEFRSGLSYWRSLPRKSIQTSPLSGDARCEVAIIGGGITGALAAHCLLEEGLDVILLDRGELAAESTAASTGLLQYEVDTLLVDLISHVGRDQAVHAYRRGLSAIDQLEAIASSLDESCGFSRRSTLNFASNDRDLARLRDEYECRREFGFPLEWLDRHLLRDFCSIDAPGAIYCSGDAQIDPYRFACLLIEKAIRGGLRAFSPTEIARIERAGDCLRLHSPTGTIFADRVVYAVGYGSDKYLERQVGDLNCTYVSTSRPLNRFDGWPDGCLLWETARPYFYARQTDDGRIILGGADTTFAQDHERDALVEKKVEQIERKFRALFPGIDYEREFAWAGTFGETKDGLAYIGEPPDRPREYFAIGYGGNGITFGMIAARTIADLIVGRKTPDAEVFRFGR